MKLKKRRERAMADLHKVMTTLWGKPCPDNEAGCPTCAAWAIYDVIDKLTDGTWYD